MVDISQLRRHASQETIPAIARLLLPHDDLRVVRDAAMLILYRSLIRRLAHDRGQDIGPIAAKTVPGLEESEALVADGDPDQGAIERAVDGLWKLGMTTRALGSLHESLLATSLDVGTDGDLSVAPASGRKNAGVYYTPNALIDHLLDVGVRSSVDLACDRLRNEPDIKHLPCVLDPAMGSAHFLVAAAQLITERLLLLHVKTGALGDLLDGDEPDDVQIRALAMRHCMHGVDIDPLAVLLARAVLCLTMGTCAGALENLKRQDALLASGDWAQVFPGVFERERPGFDCVIGNPPFQSQLATGTTRGNEATALWRARFPDAVGAYTDTASLFLLLGVSVAREGGFVSLVQPQSVLGARDARGVRQACESRGALSSLWFADRSVFEDADVRACAPCLRMGEASSPSIDVFGGLPARRLAEVDRVDGWESWVPLLAAALGVPPTPVTGVRTVGDCADVTADFRDQYYDLTGLVQERADADGAPLLTTGLIDLAHCAWGEIPARYAKKRWQAPVVSVRRIERETRHGARAAKRLVPKIIVATQTRVIELIVDEEGRYLPMVPLISVVPHEGVPIWALAAAIASPPVAAAAARAGAGTAMSTDAIKLSATQVRSLPICELNDLERAGSCLRLASTADDAEQRAAHLLEMGRLACAAYGMASDDLMAWWAQRLGVVATP